MNFFQRFIYFSFIFVIKIYQKLFLDLHVWGREHIPTGPKIYVINHITSTDPYWALSVFPEPVHTIVGPAYVSKILGWFLDFMKQINAMPDHRKTVVKQAEHYLRNGGAIFTAPEGDIQELFCLGRFYSGVAKIYRRIQVPIIPIALVTTPQAMKIVPMLDMTIEGRVYRGVLVMRGPYFINVGKPFMPTIHNDVDETEDNQRIMDEIKERIRCLAEDVRTSGEYQEQ